MAAKFKYPPQKQINVALLPIKIYQKVVSKLFKRRFVRTVLKWHDFGHFCDKFHDALATANNCDPT